MKRGIKWLIGVLIVIVVISSVLAILGVLSAPGYEWSAGESESGIRTLGIIGLALASLCTFFIVVSWAKKRTKERKIIRVERKQENVVTESLAQPSSGPANHIKDSPQEIFIKRSEGLTIIILLIAILLSYLAANFLFKGASRTVKWEYRIEAIQDLTFDSGINTLGDAGWELVFARRAMSEDKGIYECIFKRPKW